MADVQDTFPNRLPPQPPSAGTSVEVRLTRLETILPTLATKADVAASSAEVKTDLIKVMLAGLAIAVGILLFAINRASPPQSTAAGTQPIVIYAQQPSGGHGTVPAPGAPRSAK